MRRSRFVWVLALAALSANQAGAQEGCPVTTPPNPPFVPPAPYRAVPDHGKFWYGIPELWALLPVEGIWHGGPHLREKGSTIKLFLWQQGYSWRNESWPDILLAVRRLDAPAQPITSRGGTNAFVDNTTVMLTGVNLPAEGCWEITTSHNGHSLTFVISLQP